MAVSELKRPLPSASGYVTRIILLTCASVQRTVYNKHTALGIKKALIRIMRGKGGFLTAQRVGGEPGYI